MDYELILGLCYPYCFLLRVLRSGWWFTFTCVFCKFGLCSVVALFRWVCCDCFVDWWFGLIWLVKLRVLV